MQGHGEPRENIEARGRAPLGRATVELARARTPLEAVGEFVEVLGEPPVRRGQEVVAGRDGRTGEHRNRGRGEAIGVGVPAHEMQRGERADDHVIARRRRARSRTDEIGDDAQVSAQGGHCQISSAGPGAGKAGIERRRGGGDALSDAPRVTAVDAMFAQRKGHLLGRAESAQAHRAMSRGDRVAYPVELRADRDARSPRHETGPVIRERRESAGGGITEYDRRLSDMDDCQITVP